MSNATHKHKFAVSIFAAVVVAFQIPSFAAGPIAGGVTESTVLGRWEVVDMLTPKGVPRNQINASIDDLTSLGRIYDLQEDFAMYKERKIFCKFDRDLTQRNLPIAALFFDEPASKQAPSWVSTKFNGRMSNYDFRAYSVSKVTVYRYHCSRDKYSGYAGNNFEENTSEDDYRLNDVGNWFAATHDMLIMPFTSDGARILKRQPKKRVAEHVGFCAKAISANDRTICGEREIWLMHAINNKIKACVLEQYPERKIPVTELEHELAKCNGARDCVYGFTESIAERIGFSLSMKYSCKKK